MFRATVLAATTTNKASNLFGQVIHRVAKSQILVINSVRVLGSRLPIPTQLFWEYSHPRAVLGEILSAEILSRGRQKERAQIRTCEWRFARQKTQGD